MGRRWEQDLSIIRTRQWQHTILNSFSMFPTLTLHITIAEIRWKLNHYLLWLCVSFQDFLMHISDTEKRIVNIFSSLRVWFQQRFYGAACSYLKKEDSGCLFCIFCISFWIMGISNWIWCLQSLLIRKIWIFTLRFNKELAEFLRSYVYWKEHLLRILSNM